jgi:hypothetical protein
VRGRVESVGGERVCNDVLLCLGAQISPPTHVARIISRCSCSGLLLFDIHAVLWVGTVAHAEDAGGLHAKSWSDTHLGGCM